MFKRYKMEWNADNGVRSVDFFVHSKSTRNGFMHRACVLGCLPRLDEKGNNWSEYLANGERLDAKRTAKVSFCNRTWECYGGQTCLAKLWNQIADLKFLDMGQISNTNPFENDDEPLHEDLLEPDELFDGFRRA